MEELKGEWTGIMMDAEGFQARSTLALEVVPEKKVIRGTGQVSIAGQHKSTESRVDLEGFVDDSGRLHVKYHVPEQGNVNFRGSLLKVRHHAKAAICGTYTVTDFQEQVISGGVGIFWLYGK